MQYCVHNSRNDLATKWYGANLQKAMDRLSQPIAPIAPTQPGIAAPDTTTVGIPATTEDKPTTAEVIEATAPPNSNRNRSRSASGIVKDTAVGNAGSNKASREKGDTTMN